MLILLLSVNFAGSSQHGSVAAPVTASSKPSVPIGQLVTTSRHINGSHSRDRWGVYASVCPRLVTLTVPFRDTPAGSPLTLPHIHSLGSCSRRMPREPLDAPEGLLKEALCQVALGQLEDKVPGVPNEAPAGRSLDQLIRPPQQRRRDRQAERLGGLHVDDQHELGGLLDGQVSRFGALEDLADVDAGAPV